MDAHSLYYQHHYYQHCRRNKSKILMYTTFYIYVLNHPDQTSVNHFLTCVTVSGKTHLVDINNHTYFHTLNSTGYLYSRKVIPCVDKLLFQDKAFGGCEFLESIDEGQYLSYVTCLKLFPGFPTQDNRYSLLKMYSF